MRHKALIRQLQISCLGLDRIDPLCLLVDDVIEALTQPELCKYGQEPKSCTSSPMDCQCAIDAALAQTEQKPVVGITAIRTWFKDGRVVTQTLCNSWVDTTPPQRTWVGLDEVEIIGCTCECIDEGEFNMDCAIDFARAIEAKLKEKNT
jgi:hypothetical protein